jgi:aryl carrier-like protein
MSMRDGPSESLFDHETAAARWEALEARWEERTIDLQQLTATMTITAWVADRNADLEF